MRQPDPASEERYRVLSHLIQAALEANDDEELAVLLRQRDTLLDAWKREELVPSQELSDDVAQVEGQCLQIMQERRELLRAALIGRQRAQKGLDEYRRSA